MIPHFYLSGRQYNGRSCLHKRRGSFEGLYAAKGNVMSQKKQETKERPMAESKEQDGKSTNKCPTRLRTATTTTTTTGVWGGYVCRSEKVGQTRVDYCLLSETPNDLFVVHARHQCFFYATFIGNAAFELCLWESWEYCERRRSEHHRAWRRGRKDRKKTHHLFGLCAISFGMFITLLLSVSSLSKESSFVWF